MNDTNTIIKSIVKQQLKPYGFIQKGSSRIFLQDHFWYTIIAEFQPGFGRGTYLNIAANFHFYPDNSYSFDYGSARISLSDTNKKWVTFENNDQFSRAILSLCLQLIHNTGKMNNELLNYALALKSFIRFANTENGWHIYNLAILNALNENFEEAKKLLYSLMQIKVDFDWESERKDFAAKILKWITDKEFFMHFNNLIHDIRASKKLPSLNRSL